ncbi:ORFS349W.iORF1 [Human betaherpesvirus 5]|nr:ORFS349W.iORF1 [Human betaherpesvirus 5]QHX40718.1 ORFS349W.iORF1 [Human betaherpesvirus 5]
MEIIKQDSVRRTLEKSCSNRCGNTSQQKAQTLIRMRHCTQIRM